VIQLSRGQYIKSHEIITDFLMIGTTLIYRTLLRTNQKAPEATAGKPSEKERFLFLFFTILPLNAVTRPTWAQASLSSTHFAMSR
jgi:hypothetical protein